MLQRSVENRLYDFLPSNKSCTLVRSISIEKTRTFKQERKREKLGTTRLVGKMIGSELFRPKALTTETSFDGTGFLFVPRYPSPAIRGVTNDYPRKEAMMDIIGNCLAPHQRCQQLQVGGKVVGVPVDASCKVIASRRRCAHPVSIPRVIFCLFYLRLFSRINIFAPRLFSSSRKRKRIIDRSRIEKNETFIPADLIF